MRESQAGASSLRSLRILQGKGSDKDSQKGKKEKIVF